MDSEPSILKCFCGKAFSQQSALTNHSRGCKPSKKRLADALTSAKDAWAQRRENKRQKLEVGNSEKTMSSGILIDANHEVYYSLKMLLSLFLILS